MFTSDHYIKIATTIRKYTETINKDKLIADLVKMFTEDNPRFDPVKFIESCFTEDWEG